MLKLGILFSFIFLKKNSGWENHESPASGWSRLTVLPLLSLILFFREQLGIWFWIFLACASVWFFVNPFLFKSGFNSNDWMSRGVRGEQIFISLKNQEYKCHRTFANILIFITLVGMFPLTLGLWFLEWQLVAWGVVHVTLGKMWFIDRMNWLYFDYYSDHSNQNSSI